MTGDGFADISAAEERAPKEASRKGFDCIMSERFAAPSTAQQRTSGRELRGPRWHLTGSDEGYPEALKCIPDPPKHLYGVGNKGALQEGLAIVGARRATPYGRACARRFAQAAAEKGVIIISGGARGCDAEAHRAALEAQTPTVVFLGGGCNELYPAEHRELFQRIVDAGGAVVSEHPDNMPPRPYHFRARNRLIAGLARAVLIVEAGLPSGTFSTADEALAANRDVLVVPGAITSSSSRGANRLLYQGATPIVDDETFEDVLFSLFGCLKHPLSENKQGDNLSVASLGFYETNPVVAAVCAEALALEDLYPLAQKQAGDKEPHAWLMECLVEAEQRGLIARHPGGRWGPRGL